MAVTTLATAALLAGCSSSSGGEGAGGEPIKLAVFNGWDEGIAVSILWQVLLGEEGQEVELEWVDVAPAYQGLADGDYDVATDIWLPVTHASYMEQYGEQIEHLGYWNDEAKLTIAVNEDAPIDSLTELNDNADLFGGRLIGIEPGAGLTGVVESAVIPTYGLDDLEFLTSSTPAMLTELKAASEAGENIAVTLWQPHWAYGAFPIKNLEDPEGALGETETINTFARLGFSEDHPELAEWLGEFKMDSETLADLTNLMFNENAGASESEWVDIVTAWVEDNPEYIDSIR